MENDNKQNDSNGSADIFIERPVVTIENKYFKASLSNKSLQHYIFKNVGAKKIVFTNIDFSYSIFERAYFHECEFINCKFIGCRFIESNFRGATFDDCSFEYLTIRLTQISHKEILSNLPVRPNVKREMMRSFRINADSIGDIAASKEFVRVELLASREHLKKARAGKKPYYDKKYSGFKRRVEVYWDSVWSFVDWHLWGHGEYPHKLVIAVISSLLIIVGFLMSESKNLDGSISISQALHLFISTVRDVSFAFLGVKVTSISNGWLALLSLIRYISLSLFISVLYKRLARR